MIFSSNDVLSVGQLKRLAEHKYSASGSTLLDPIMQPFWNWLVLKFPMWVAPNLMTIAGLIVNIVTSLILVYYSPDARQSAPWWTFLLCGLGLFIYQTLDALDGKQARRTGSSSPLGELFDHGCDSVSTVFVTLGICIAVQLGTYPSLMFFQCFATISLFYCAHWQTYVSGTLRFGKFDVTEVQFSVIAVHLISAIFGPSFWSTQIPFINMEVRFVPFIGQVIGSTIAICSYCSVIFTGGAGKNGSTVAIPFLHVEFRLMPVVLALSVTFLMCYNYIAVILSGGVGKNGSTVAGTSVLSPFIPMGLVVLPAFIIYQKSKFNVYENHPCLYILAFGFVAAKVTNRLVVAHMTKSEMSYLDSVLVGPGMLFLNQYFNFFIPEYAVLWLCLVYAGADLLHYCFIVCNQICYHLNIHLLKITPKSATAVGTSKIIETQSLHSPRVANVLNTSNDPSEILDHDTAPYQQLSPNVDDDSLDNYEDLEIQDNNSDRQRLLP